MKRLSNQELVCRARNHLGRLCRSHRVTSGHGLCLLVHRQELLSRRSNSPVVTGNYLTNSSIPVEGEIPNMCLCSNMYKIPNSLHSPASITSLLQISHQHPNKSPRHPQSSPPSSPNTHLPTATTPTQSIKAPRIPTSPFPLRRRISTPPPPNNQHTSPTPPHSERTHSS